ncbi:MAG: HAMP domain-containing sensor histidine kinase [Rikenellaceae bacterium]
MNSQQQRSRQSYMFLALLILLWGLMICFVSYQYSRERQFKVDMLNTSLQQLNYHLMDEYGVLGSVDDLYNRNAKRYDGLRITMLRKDGEFIFDSHYPISKLSHIERNPEVKEAIEHGESYNLRGDSLYSDIDYFYSATCIGDTVVRTALPYTLSLYEVLDVSNTFLFVALIISIIISVIGFIASRLYTSLEIANRRLDDEHALKLKEEQEKIRIKRQLTNNINHELKTPVCSILGYLEMVLNNESMEPALLRSFVKKSYDQAERLRSLMSDLATITRIDEAQNLIECSELDIKRLVDDVVDDTTPQAQMQFIDVASRLSGEIKVMANEGLLYSVFRNLIDNAISYSGGRNVWIECVKETSDMWFFVVRDNGIGVDEEHLEHIFGRFYRVDKGRSRKMGGTGLGLSIVKNAVIFHGGTIEATLSPKGGLIFTFSIAKVAPKHTLAAN